ncbi:hypothetical protein CALVIDRAFT_562008 [Calocera viscosa TUFC12733]|uniref:Ubiquitin-like protease family profile domain-containing protein n=1 Tax=Calocera viscosa (strain TUFC12733) TaxID=1330018 RepID=A0A167P9J1_CALVF|nr:hypothetical protein CALVIDRAFT_562008 [Calocera viscosa TUFC12733]
MEFPRPKIRFEPPKRRTSSWRAKLRLANGGAVGTPRSPPGAAGSMRIRKKKTAKRESSLDRPLPSLAAGSQWRGAAVRPITPVATPMEATMEEWEDVFRLEEPDPRSAKSRKGRHARAKAETYERWLMLLPDLIKALKSWSSSALRDPQTGGGASPWEFECSPDCNDRRVHRITCVDFTGYKMKSMGACPQHPVAPSLVRTGYWPSSPTRPPRAFSIDLLNHYVNLYDTCATPNDAFCGALIRSHAERGFYYLRNEPAHEHSPFADPWRRSFSSAAFWILRALETGINMPLEIVRATGCNRSVQHASLLTAGADLPTPLDGNRQLKRLRTGGSSPCVHEPDLFLPKSSIDQTRSAMDRAKKESQAHDTAKRTRITSDVFERCRKAFKVADEDANIVSDQLFDITGVVIMVCRHDVPLFVCDITTPGERQEYGLALIWALLNELPKTATVGVLYDIGCQLDHSCDLFNYLGDDRGRVTFACSVLHAYGHEWACQVVYHPRRRTGFGLTDGEGSERVWSRTRRLIPILRRANDGRRSFALERKFQNCGTTMKTSLGGWFKRKYKLIKAHRTSARAEIEASGLTIPQLREQLELQRAEPSAQKPQSGRELQRKLELFKKMQNELDKVAAAIQETVETMSEEFGLPSSSGIFARLRERNEELRRYGHALFSDMKLDRAIPQLFGVPAQFLHYLLQAREEKINIRSRVVQHLWELTRLQRARGGGHDPVGTKVRDAILKGWAPRWRTTKAAVERYNRYVESLEKIPTPGLIIALPTKLELSDLHNPTEDHSLWQDVWWPTFTPPPGWVTSEKVRRGITAILTLDRCEEEEQRLMWESENMVRWWVEERRSLIRARAEAPDPADCAALERRLREHEWLEYRWSCPPLSAHRWKSIKDQLDAGHCPPAPEDRMSSVEPVELQWNEVVTRETWGVEESDRSSASDWSDAYDHAMADLDLLVEELGAVVVDKRDLDGQSEQDEIDGGSEAGEDAEDPERPSAGNSRQDSNMSRSELRDDPWRCDLVEIPRTMFTSSRSLLLDGRQVGLQAREIEVLQGLTEWLSDAHMNTFGALFNAQWPQEMFLDGTRNVLIFSTFAAGQLQRAGDNEKLRRAWYEKYVAKRRRADLATNMSLSRYDWDHCWSKSCWLFPLYKNDEHWLLVRADLDLQRLLLYDSLPTGHWITDLNLVKTMMNSISELSDRPLPSGTWSNWRASRVRVIQQTNGYDCGLWVLAQMLAVSRGFDRTSQQNMALFRSWLHAVAMRLPEVGEHDQEGEAISKDEVVIVDQC